jgi:hypothetical protein
VEKLVWRCAADLTQPVATDPRVLEELKKYLSEREPVELNDGRAGRC